MDSAKQRKGKRLAFSLLTILIWATGYISTRVCAAHFSPLALTCFRLFIASFGLLLLLPLRKPKRPALKDLPLLLLSGLSGYTGFYILISLAAQTITASVSSFVVSLSPVITPVIALFILKEHMSPIKWASVGVAACGVGILLFTDRSFSIEFGVLQVFFAALLFGIFNIVQRILLRTYTSFEVTAYSIFLGTLITIPWIPEAWHQVTQVPPIAIWVTIYMGLSSTLAYFCWAKALNLADYTSEVTNFMFLTPILTTILGLLTIGELPPLSSFFGGAFMLLGVILVGFDEKKGQADTPAPVPASPKEERTE